MTTKTRPAHRTLDKITRITMPTMSAWQSFRSRGWPCADCPDLGVFSARSWLGPARLADCEPLAQQYQGARYRPVNEREGWLCLDDSDEYAFMACRWPVLSDDFAPGRPAIGPRKAA
jgi:hypothetical protein